MNISVGILTAKHIDFRLEGNYTQKQLPDGVLYEHSSIDDYFELNNVTIGIGFHWERQETQRFRGSLKIVRADGYERAINIVDIECYLESVISSEMSSTSSLELLKTHAIISRSWAANAIVSERTVKSEPTFSRSATRIMRYYERDAHNGFDVCADDHCQRYQGITRICSENVRNAIEATCGMVLKYGNEIADTRFYKCCGGATEPFENVWANRHYEYLIAQRDSFGEALPDLSDEEQARKWIMSSPKAFCNTKDRAVLSQVLNNYDQETADFYRWRVEYSQAELSDIIYRKSGIDFGIVTDIEPVRRGPSGRLMEIRISGTKQSMTVGKELEIRKWLSESHLYSSAFIVERTGKGDFVLYGAGWGHGVGLCQIGAAMMAQEGYGYREILEHYFPHTTLEKL